VTHSEAPVGVWLWLVLIVVVNALWISMDVWLGRHGYEALTTELREGLRHQVWGPLIAGGIAFTATAFVFHMFLAPFYR
jgi:hypothetical protein